MLSYCIQRFASNHKPQTFSRVCLRLKRRVCNFNLTARMAVGSMIVIEVQTQRYGGKRGVRNAEHGVRGRWKMRGRRKMGGRRKMRRRWKMRDRWKMRGRRKMRGRWKMQVRGKCGKYKQRIQAHPPPSAQPRSLDISLPASPPPPQAKGNALGTRFPGNEVSWEEVDFCCCE